MESPPTHLRKFLAGTLAGFLVCAILQWSGAYGLGWKSSKTESNYFTSLSRFQAAASGAPAEFTLVGSSISGRLPGKEVGNSKVANLGTDGGCLTDGMRMLVEGRVKAGKWIVLESNTIERAVKYEASPILKAVGGPVFRAGTHLPVFSYQARPSGMLYDRLLKRPAGDTTTRRFPLARTTLPKGIQPRDALEKKTLDELIRMIAMLRESGSRIILVEYPSAPMRPEGREVTDRATAYVAEMADVPFVNLEQQIPHENLQFTDGVHLAPGSARAVLDSLQEFITTLPSSQP
ncbi:hypothetical protein KBB96_15240 [Luteolibacter ambystomatis]|uniref:SGNH/GDSL hydrolase family protein n=1 Tax=Luteolibacter ambystomatis TaxID=2824561 RepID=A0A975IYT5_9BACT|nr:hypothetical protein [Luteolibacter ambystomatis]QUE50218.1 hypothetical protein KBB96_15240 [Luteolibacter ambystomatis]